ncbi:MAG: reverse transcriptase/maturase family protein [Gammaproteobacteria bacterium]|nr:reverse transcriptase/maturase family protein [Gammaproteobacteria bacterium]
MKTFRHLFPQVWDFDNLCLAARKARRRKRWKPATMDFERHVEENLLDLQEELRTLTWQPGAPRCFVVTRPKAREISAAPYRDRVVHHALCNVIEPVLEARFIHDSYACRPGKGTHAALDRCQTYLRRCRYGLRGDVRRYFPSIDHATLLDMLGRRFPDPDLMTVIARIVGHHQEAAWKHLPLPGDDLLTALERPAGLPIGNLTSQLFANLYLHDLDTFVTQDLRPAGYLRYMDDFVLFHDDKGELARLRGRVDAFLAERLRLTLHPRKSQVFACGDGTPFLGFHLYPRRRRLLARGIREFKRRFREHRQDYLAGRMTLPEITGRVRCWIGHAAHADSYRLRRRLFAGLAI